MFNLIICPAIKLEVDEMVIKPLTSDLYHWLWLFYVTSSETLAIAVVRYFSVIRSSVGFLSNSNEAD
jgi:hypothetical protein